MSPGPAGPGGARARTKELRGSNTPLPSCRHRASPEEGQRRKGTQLIIAIYKLSERLGSRRGLAAFRLLGCAVVWGLACTNSPEVPALEGNLGVAVLLTRGP